MQSEQTIKVHVDPIYNHPQFKWLVAVVVVLLLLCWLMTPPAEMFTMPTFEQAKQWVQSKLQ